MGDGCLGGGRAFAGLSAVGAGLPSGLAVAPKVASAPRGQRPARPCGQPCSIPAAGGGGAWAGGGIFWGGGFGRFETPFVAVKKRDNLRPNDQRLRY